MVNKLFMIDGATINKTFVRQYGVIIRPQETCEGKRKVRDGGGK